MNPSARIDLLSADSLAIVVFGVLAGLGRVDATHAVMAILAVLAGRLSPRPWPSVGGGGPKGAPEIASATQAPSSRNGGPPSGVATLAAGALGVMLWARDSFLPLAAADAARRHG